MMKKIQDLEFSEVIEILNITQAEINKKLKFSKIHLQKQAESITSGQIKQKKEYQIVKMKYIMPENNIFSAHDRGVRQMIVVKNIDSLPED